jgi:hypothetical protein
MKFHRLLVLSVLLFGATHASDGLARDAGNVANGVPARTTGPKSMNPRPPVAHKDEIQVESIKSQRTARNANNSASARTTGPKGMNPRPPVAHKDEIEILSVKSPRDPASGRATGKRANKP